MRSNSLQMALIADPHVSLLDVPHTNIRLIDTVAMVEAIAADLEQRRPDLAVWMGDLTHEGTPQIRSRFQQIVRRVTVPSLWMLGNHDVERVTKRAFSREVGPCIDRLVMTAAGWTIVIVDTVPELTPGNPIGVWSEDDLRLLTDAAATAAGRLLVIAHHPLRAKYIDMDPFWNAVSSFRGTGVFIGGHSHRDLYSLEHGWHLLDVSSSCREPVGYHMVELTPGVLNVCTRAVRVALTGAAPTDWAADAPVYPLSISVGSA